MWGVSHSVFRSWGEGLVGDNGIRASRVNMVSFGGGR